MSDVPGVVANSEACKDGEEDNISVKGVGAGPCSSHSSPNDDLVR